jgi:hypothetical protein
MTERRRPEFTDGFETGRLDRARWVPAYLPQWSSVEAATPTWEIDRGRLILSIAPGQAPWCPEFDGETRVSSIQTGVFSGPAGSTIGQHRFAPDVVVRQPQAEERLYVPHFGRIEIRASACPEPDAMVALWMIGFESRPADAGEICVVEIFSRDVAPGQVAVGMGVHPHHDPRLRDDFERIRLAIDATEPHDYAVEWTSDRIEWEVDGRTVRRSGQSPDYPMQLMLGIYSFRPLAEDERPRRFAVEHVRGFPPIGGRPAA